MCVCVMGMEYYYCSRIRAIHAVSNNNWGRGTLLSGRIISSVLSGVSVQSGRAVQHHSTLV